MRMLSYPQYIGHLWRQRQQNDQGHHVGQFWYGFVGGVSCRETQGQERELKKPCRTFSRSSWFMIQASLIILHLWRRSLPIWTGKSTRSWKIIIVKGSYWRAFPAWRTRIVLNPGRDWCGYERLSIEGIYQHGGNESGIMRAPVKKKVQDNPRQ